MASYHTDCRKFEGREYFPEDQRLSSEAVWILVLDAFIKYEEKRKEMLNSIIVSRLNIEYLLKLNEIIPKSVKRSFFSKKNFVLQGVFKKL